MEAEIVSASGGVGPSPSLQFAAATISFVASSAEGDCAARSQGMETMTTVISGAIGLSPSLQSVNILGSSRPEAYRDHDWL